MNKLSLFLKAVLAGMCICIGGVVYLSCPNKIVGAFLFAVGLYVICTQGLNLYTGKVGYLVNEDSKYLIDLVYIWLGNLVGTVGFSWLILQTRYASLSEVALKASEGRLNDNLLSLLILGIFCGVLMYVAVDGYKKTQNPLILFACVAAFIICGFEHCIADMVYFTLARVWSIDTILRILGITLGNSLGGCLIPFIQKIK